MSDNNQDKTSYYYASGNKKIELQREPAVRLVKYKQGSPSERSRLSERASALLPSESTVMRLNRYDAYVIATDKDISRSAKDISDRLQDIVKSEDNIEFASVAYRQGNNPDLMFTTKELVARVKEGVSRKDIESLLSKYNIRILSEEPWAPGLLRLETEAADGPKGPVALGNILMETDKFEYAKASFIRQRHIRTVEAREDNYYRDQWHLEITKTFEAWNISKGNPNIRICIADTGVDYAHREFDGKIVIGYDFDLDIADGNPKEGSQDDHGTSCAGVATAAGIKAAGAAPQCSLIAVRTPPGLGDIDEAKMFVWAANNGADVISCSWGPPDGFGSVDPIPPETEDALKHCVTKGREGKGCCIFWAAGNGDESVDDDGYASSEYVMAIAASTNPNDNGEEDRSYYSDKGKALHVCAPSNGGSKAILTTDRLGSSGYNPRRSPTPDPDGNYTDGFGGTSSATPLVAGIAGLMLSVNPSLTVDQVRDILRRTADKIGDKSTYKPDGSTGLTHSELYGYGRVNTLAAVQAAQKLKGESGSSIQMETFRENKNVDKILRTDYERNSFDESLWIKK
jgi:subtilisin family serine protease